MTRPPTSPRGRLRVIGLGVVLAALALVGVGAAPPAAAHDRLIGSSPASGDTVSRVPAAVELTFSRPVLELGVNVVVTGPEGEAGDGAPQLFDDRVRQDLRAGAPAGTYRVSWRVTSRDGHPITGEFTFTAAAAGRGDASAPASPPADRVSPSRRVSRWLLVAVALAVTGLSAAGLRRLRGRRA